MTKISDLSKLDFTEVEVRKAFIEENESSIYAGTTIDGDKVIVELEQGVGMNVKVLNSKNWYECVEYNENGFRVCEWVEKG